MSNAIARTETAAAAAAVAMTANAPTIVALLRFVTLAS